MYFESVVSVKKIRVDRTFDLKVSPNNNFILSNGILSHNSGKTTGAISTHKYIATKTLVPFTVDDVLPNEQYYPDAVKYAKPHQSIIIDEQKEQQTGLGCLTAGHKIFTDIGWVNIERLEKQPERKILSVNPINLQFEWIPKFKFMKFQNNSFMKRITVSDGTSIMVTPEHKLPVLSRNGKIEFMEAFNLKEGDFLCTVENFPHVKELSMDNNLAELIGLIISDGHLSKIKRECDCNARYRPIDYWRKHDFYWYATSFINKDKKVMEHFKKIFSKVFPKFNLFISEDNKAFSAICNNRKVFEKLNEFIPKGNKSHKVRIPESIFRAGVESKKRFVMGLFIGDGSYPNDYIFKRGGKIQYYTVSEGLCKDLKLLLGELGFQTQIRKQFNPKGFKPFTIWTLAIHTRRQISKFISEIIKGGKIAYKNKDRTNYTVPYLYDAFIRHDKGIKWKFKDSFRKKGNVTKLRLIRNKKEFKHITFLKNYIESCIDFRKITKIEKECTHSPVYDIEVPKNHSFIVDGILSRNSFRIMQHTEDLNNIVAKLCLNISWVHPPEFVGRGGFYGLETCGRDFEHKLTRFLLYDLTQKMFGISSIPLGFVIIPKYRDQAFEDKYEKKKDVGIDAIRNEDVAVVQQNRLDEGFALAKSKLFQKVKNNHQKIQIARKLFPMRTEGEYMELVSIAIMNLKFGIAQKDFDEAKEQVDKDLKEIKDAKRDVQ